MVKLYQKHYKILLKNKMENKKEKILTAEEIQYDYAHLMYNRNKEREKMYAQYRGQTLEEYYQYLDHEWKKIHADDKDYFINVNIKDKNEIEKRYEIEKRKLDDFDKKQQYNWTNSDQDLINWTNSVYERKQLMYQYTNLCEELNKSDEKDNTTINPQQKIIYNGKNKIYYTENESEQKQKIEQEMFDLKMKLMKVNMEIDKERINKNWNGLMNT